MQEKSIFTQIIEGEIPSFKVYEDGRTFAFLDIYPVQPGHVLVVPKVQVDRLQDLPDEDYAALMYTVKRVMQRQVEVLGGAYRPCVKVEGFDVPHAHIHVFPCRDASEFYNRSTTRASEEELKEMAARLAF